MKKCLMLFFSAVMIFGLGFGLAACGHHEHNITWTTVIQPSCTQEGLRTGKCDGCDEEFSEKIDMLPHEYGDWLVLKGSTCQEEGSRQRTCSVCQHTETETIAKTDHFPQTTQVEVAPKCEEVGYTAEIKCSECGELLQERKEIAATGHTYGEWRTLEQATCQHGGREEQTCEVCNAPNIKYTAQLPHEWQKCEAVAEQPGFHKHKCSVCNTEETLACVFGPEQLEMPTCSKNGERFEICVECGYKDVIQVLDATGHELIYVPESVFDEKSDEGHKHQHYQKCTKCDEYPKVLQDCNLVTQRTEPGTCTTAEYEVQVCSDCQVVHEHRTKEATGHTWTYEKISAYPHARHTKKCGVCGTEEVVACDLTVTRQKQDCTHAATATYTCALCENSRTISEGYAALGHDYRDDWTFDPTAETPSHKRVCHRDGCQDFEIAPCEEEDIGKLPTCVDPGSTKTACRVCLQVLSGSDLDALGHNWSEEWVRVGDSHYHECQTCHQRESKPHDFDQLFVPSTSCEENDKTKYTCKECQFSYEVTNDGTTKPHRWKVTSIEDGKHHAQCEECHTVSEGVHDWSESNICSVCQYDGLIYDVVSEHAIVKKSERLAKTKNIVINPLHKILGAGGQYETTEYRVTEIADAAFMNFDGVEHVTLPYTLEKIGNNSFSGCSHLQNVTLVSDEQNPASLTRIEGFAFYACGALQTFNPPESISYIGEYAFANCVTLYEITIPDGVENIEPSAFMNTNFTSDSKNWKDDMLYLGKHLIKVRNTLQDDGTYTNTTVTVAKGTLTIAAKAFAECKEIEKVILPAELKHIDADAFLNCEKLAQVEFQGDIYQWLAITFVNDYSSPLYYGNTGLHVATVGEDGIVDLTNPEVVKHNITHIPSGTFRGTDLKKIILPDSLISIGEEAFENCAQLTEIVFNGDSNLAYVGKDVLKGCTAYRNDDQNWDLDHKVLYMGGKVLVEAETSLSGTYNVKDETLIIVAEAFKDCQNLETVNINASLRYVGDLAFDGCSSIKTVEFADKTYVWLCTQVKNGFSRSLTGDKLNWGYLQNYKYSWKRLYKASVKP